MFVRKVSRVLSVCAISGTEEAVLRNYTRPPIVEAIVGFRYADISPWTESHWRRMAEAFGDELPLVLPMKDLSVHIDVAAQEAQTSAQPIGLLLGSQAGHRRITLMNHAVFAHCIGPYPGWSTLLLFVETLRNVVADVASTAKTNLAEVRYIDRMEVPTDADIWEYLAIRPPFPNLEAVGGFSYSTAFGMDGVQGVLNIARRAPHMVEYDVTVSTDCDDETWRSRTGHLHEAQREMFEACITDSMRELFE